MGCSGSKSHDAHEGGKGHGGDGDGEDDRDYNPLTQEEVNARIQSSDGTLNFPLGQTGLSLRYAYLSQRGYYPEDLYKANQDAFKVIPSFNNDPNQILFGVFDGHGVDGDSCSYFVRDSIEETLKKLIAKYPNDFERAYKETFISINGKMHEQAIATLLASNYSTLSLHHTPHPSLLMLPHSMLHSLLIPPLLCSLLSPHSASPQPLCQEIQHSLVQHFDDSMSGTTAICAFFKGAEMTIANIGDSRAVVGEKKGKRVVAYSLSIDQTPYRADERERVKAAGAVVMSCDQLEGIVPYHENWGVNLGEELDNGGDPPRVWAPGKTFPGCAFTRSIGDSVAESIGVFAEPELLVKHITADDQFVVVASDGVWEFLTNQSVTDMILKFSDPLEACRAVVAESYRLWLQYEVATPSLCSITHPTPYHATARSPSSIHALPPDKYLRPAPCCSSVPPAVVRASRLPSP